MKKFPVILAVVVSVAFAGFAQAAKPKKRTRNANRVGAYGMVFIGSSSYKSDQSGNEQDLVDFSNNLGADARNFTASSDTGDIGYQLGFGYRFNRYLATELGLVHYGELATTAHGE